MPVLAGKGSPTNSRWGFKYLLIQALALVLVFFAVNPVQAAGGAQVYLSPSSKTVTTGANVVLSLKVAIDSGVKGSAIELYGSYDKDNLELVGIDGTGSPFDFKIEENGEDGNFEIVRAAFGPDVTGDVLVSKLTFKVLTNQGGVVSLDESSKLSDPDGKLVPLTLKNATLKGSTTDSGSTTTPSTSTTKTVVGTQPSSSTSTVKQTGLSLSARDSYVGYTLVLLDVTASRDVKVSVAYGTSETDLDYSTKQTELGRSHKVLLDTRIVLPGTTYFYKVTAVDKSGSSASSSPNTFTTLGLPLSLKILDKNGNPVVGKQVSLKSSDDITSETDENGIATFALVPGGDLTFVVSRGWGRSSEHLVSVSSNTVKTLSKKGGSTLSYSQTAEPAQETINLDYKPLSLSIGNVLRLIAAVTVLGFVAKSLLPQIRKIRNDVVTAKSTGLHQPPSTIVYPQNPQVPYNNVTDPTANQNQPQPPDNRPQ